jgi:glycosyltransferase involved in cell wall biosynthesis
LPDPRSLSIVIPAYNEAARIANTLEALRRDLSAIADTWEVRVVDDGSDDDTAGIVAAVSARDARFVLQRQEHRGKGAAARAGLQASCADLRFLCDADLSMPLTELPRFLALVTSHGEIAIGTREGAEAHRLGEPLHRHLVGRAFNTLVRVALLQGFQDTQCGFKLLSRQAAEAIVPHMTLDGWAFDIELLWIARHVGFRVSEVPIEWHFQPASRLSVISDSVRMARDIWRVRKNARRGIYGPPNRDCRQQHVGV